MKQKRSELLRERSLEKTVHKIKRITCEIHKHVVRQRDWVLISDLETNH